MMIITSIMVPFTCWGFLTWSDENSQNAEQILHNLKKFFILRYGWHFPELGKILTDNIAFIKTIKLVGMRENFNESELSDLLPPDLEEKVKEAAEVSMGTEISEEDILNIRQLCDEIIAIHEYRTHLYDYLKTRMMAIAPNLTVLVGETVGARLIAHAGSLVNLAKHPSSTVQILGKFEILVHVKLTPSSWWFNVMVSQ